MPKYLPELAFAGVLSVTLMLPVPALAEERVSIPFADIGNIYNWHSDDSNELYVQSLNKDWYRITFWSPCTELPFAVGIAFVTDSIGSLDKFSSILVNGERCWFKTFEKSEAPDTDARK